jgi:hypothetical protein
LLVAHIVVNYKISVKNQNPKGRELWIECWLWSRRTWIFIRMEYTWLQTCYYCYLFRLLQIRRRAGRSSRGVLPTGVRRCVWSRNLVNEEALAHSWLSNRKKGKQANSRLELVGTCCITD